MKIALWQGNGQIMAFVSSTLTNNVIKPNLGACNVGFVIAANYFSGALVSISIGRWSHWAWALKSLYTAIDCH